MTYTELEIFKRFLWTCTKFESQDAVAVGLRYTICILWNYHEERQHAVVNAGTHVDAR